MDVLPISSGSIRPEMVTGTELLRPQGTLSAKNEEPFSGLVSELLQRANAPHQEADLALRQLVSGDTDNVHNVVMSVVKADMSFRFMLELRNRLTEAYQEVMRMQI